jgi:hypothetical protein
MVRSGFWNEPFFADNPPDHNRKIARVVFVLLARRSALFFLKRGE